MIRTILAAIALSASSGAAAHDFWLQPENHIPREGEDVRVDFKIGDPGEDANDWGVYWERIASFRLYGPHGASDQQTAIRTTGGAEPGGAVVRLEQPGSYVLSFESNPSFSDLEAGRFDRYVANTGLAAIAAHRASRSDPDARGTELYARRAKALMQVGDALTANVTAPIGQLLEIVPLENPFALVTGDILPVQVMWRGEPLEGAQLAVARPHGGEGEDYDVFTTDEDGRAEFELRGGSRYLLTVVWGVPAPADARADYFTVFSSLTFPAPYPATGEGDQ